MSIVGEGYETNYLVSKKRKTSISLLCYMITVVEALSNRTSWEKYGRDHCEVTSEKTYSLGSKIYLLMMNILNLTQFNLPQHAT